MKRAVLLPIGLVGVVFLIAFSYIQIRTNPQTCHLMHLAFPPQDLRRPIVLDRDTLRNGQGRYEFTFSPEYCEIYELGFITNIVPVPPSFNPGVRLRAHVVSNTGGVIAEVDRIKPTRISHATSGYGAGKISYGSFGVSRHDEQISVILEVSGDRESSDETTASLDFFIAVSGSP